MSVLMIAPKQHGPSVRLPAFLKPDHSASATAIMDVWVTMPQALNSAPRSAIDGCSGSPDSNAAGHAIGPTCCRPWLDRSRWRWGEGSGVRWGPRRDQVPHPRGWKPVPNLPSHQRQGIARIARRLPKHFDSARGSVIMLEGQRLPLDCCAGRQCQRGEGARQ